METKVIGIRPGEKLHEVMVTSDDGRHTIMLEDRYVIQPAFAYWEQCKKQYSTAENVGEDFSYTSDNNHEWLDKAGLEALLNGLEQEKAA